MLKFSTKLAIENAGCDFDYIVMCWNPTSEVLEWIDANGFEHYIYSSDKRMSFVENHRSMINIGFNKCFEKNDYACAIGTDMACYRNYLLNLVKYAEEDRIINCAQIESGIFRSLHPTRNFGIPTEKDFDLKGFYEYCERIYQDKLLTEKECGRRIDSTPHLMHRSVWENFGPWDVKIVADVAFFDKVKRGGIKNFMSQGSLVYHHGRVETTRIENKNPLLRLKRDSRKILSNIKNRFLL